MTSQPLTESDIPALIAEIARLKNELTESRRAQAWIESRAADLDFEVQTLRQRLRESQEARSELERRLRIEPAA